MWNLNIWIIVTISTCTNGYDLKCPHSSQWNFTSRSLGCYNYDQKIYICLFDAIKSYASKAVFKAICGPKDFSREGSRYILTPDLHQVPCAASRYQPYTFKTDGYSQCVLSKSLCNASGQIKSDDGSVSTDASCRCNYRQNYDYVIPPKDPCSCKPAEEDCSCYIRKCDEDKVMIADYRCMKRVDTILPEDIKCPIISRIIPQEETDTVYKIQLLSVVTDSRTWSTQASIVLIVIVIIYTVLIGFLFFSVPYVTSILLISKFQLTVKRKENEFMILNGDNVKIECNIKSYIPDRLVTWQREVDGEIIQITSSMEKYEMDLGKRPSLTIDNFNADDQGKYRCIVRNAVGLRNEMFGSCRNLMSRVGWLTRFMTVLQHIPVFHTKDITLHIYGMIHAGLEYAQIRNFLTECNLPVMSKSCFQKHEKKIGKIFVFAAEESCKNAQQLEKEISADKELELEVSFDAGWQKRGSGFNYNSLTGHASMIGKQTGKVTCYDIRSKSCKFCEHHEGKKDTIPSHDL